MRVTDGLRTGACAVSFACESVNSRGELVYNSNMPRLRFSIRSMLLFTALAAMVIWWTTTPTRVTAAFVSAINQGDFERAGSMFVVEGADDMLTKWQPMEAAHVVPSPLTVKDLVRGRRGVHLTVTYKNASGELTGYFLLEAGFGGIHSLNKRPYEGADFKFR